MDPSEVHIVVIGLLAGALAYLLAKHVVLCVFHILTGRVKHIGVGLHIVAVFILVEGAGEDMFLRPVQRQSGGVFRQMFPRVVFPVGSDLQKRIVRIAVTCFSHETHGFQISQQPIGIGLPGGCTGCGGQHVQPVGHRLLLVDIISDAAGAAAGHDLQNGQGPSGADMLDTAEGGDCGSLRLQNTKQRHGNSQRQRQCCRPDPVPLMGHSLCHGSHRLVI